MDNLVLNIKGEIIKTNIDEWKTNILERLKTVNIEPVSDEDFLFSTDLIKEFKNAENNLKVSKENALKQLDDVNSVFMSIDQISARIRETRLILERKLREKKNDIKNDIIEKSIYEIAKKIESIDILYSSIDFSEYIDRKRFENIIKGKSSIGSIEKALRTEVKSVIRELSIKEELIKKNSIILEDIQGSYDFLFMDKSNLLLSDSNKLELIIYKRISVYKSIDNDNKDTLIELHDLKTKTGNLQKPISSNLATFPFKISIQIKSTKDAAINLSRKIRKDLANELIVENIKLSQLNITE